MPASLRKVHVCMAVRTDPLAFVQDVKNLALMSEILSECVMAASSCCIDLHPQLLTHTEVPDFSRKPAHFFTPAGFNPDFAEALFTGYLYGFGVFSVLFHQEWVKLEHRSVIRKCQCMAQPPVKFAPLEQGAFCL